MSAGDLTEKEVNALLNSMNDIPPADIPSNALLPPSIFEEPEFSSSIKELKRKFDRQRKQNYTPPRKDEDIIYICSECDVECEKITIHMGRGKKKYGTYCPTCGGTVEVKWKD